MNSLNDNTTIMKNSPKKMTYLSLFSSAGVGCFGFKMNSFECVATVEILQKRLNIQKYNNKCKYISGYIGEDITLDSTKNKIREQLKKFNIDNKKNQLDVLIATPPCQGMSVANHKKNNEINRNSLVTESIILTKEIKPKFFVYENVRSFLKTECTDIDGVTKPIKDAIENNLSSEYNIIYHIINFKDYGCPSSRTRTLVIGTRKDLKEVSPYSIFPSKHIQKTLFETIGHLDSLKVMGEISKSDIFHSFRKYTPEMRNWIKNLKQGESAFDNKNPSNRPHKIIDGEIIQNARKNGDKYTRQVWDKVAPCIHTRNDILSSQSTIHPKDDRVFSIRELMLMMSVPNNFKWSEKNLQDLNLLNDEEKRKFLTKEELTIRHSLGEAVPTVIFNSIAKKIKHFLDFEDFNDQKINKIIEENSLIENDKLIDFIKQNSLKLPYFILSKISELTNTLRNENAAYYTSQDICYSIIKDLPAAKDFKFIRILEPSIGVGNFLPLLIEKYKEVPEVVIDVVDIDENSILILKLLLNSIEVPYNVKINIINDDFLLHNFDNVYDIVVGNPPFKKLTNNKKLLSLYKKDIINTQTNNLFAFFIEKSLRLGNIVSLIVPKSLINSPEFNKTREIIENKCVAKITDYGEKGFKGVKIETISFIINTQKKNNNNAVLIESYIQKLQFFRSQEYIFSKEFPYWLIYRNDFFDEVSLKMKFDIFNAFRDRQITKKITKDNGKFRVLKSRNIATNKTIDIDKYDSYTDEIESLGVSKYLNNTEAVLVPNLTYYPRACFLPENCIVDGSVAILTLKNGSRKIVHKDLEYFGSKEYEDFYRIARNFGTRSLNIDNNSVFFFGIRKNIDD
jgi:DNA (cytosine-5)-methyltransferase 1